MILTTGSGARVVTDVLTHSFPTRRSSDLDCVMNKAQYGTIRTELIYISVSLKDTVTKTACFSLRATERSQNGHININYDIMKPQKLTSAEKMKQPGLF